MTDAERLEARYQESLERSKQLEADILRLQQAGISLSSPIVKAAEREIHRVSDELIAASEMRNAAGTGSAAVEATYQDLVRRSMRLQDALVSLFEAGIAAGSPIHGMVEAEAVRLEDALNAAMEQREAVRAKR